MKIDEILNLFRNLAMSQGFYGRLLANIEELKKNDEESYDNFVSMMENKNFQNPLDVILFVEG